MKKMMRKKAFTAMLFAVMVLATVCSSAEELASPRVYNLEEEASLWAEMLGYHQPLQNLWIGQHYDSYVDLIREHQPDFFCLCSHLRDVSPLQLYDEGIIASFFPTDAMLAEIASLPRYVQEAVQSTLMTDDGKMLGYPVAGYNICEFPSFIGYWIPGAWAQSPFKDMPYPTSFEEMLDFMELYLDTPHDGFLFYYCTQANKESFLNDLFWRPLMQSWIVQCRYAGKPVIYTDPKFIELAERARNLYQRMLKVDYSTKVNKKKHYLFADSSRTGFSYNEADTFTCETIIPLRVTADQPPLINLDLDVYFVLADSPWVDRAAELFEKAVDTRIEEDHQRKYNWVDEWAFPTLFDVESNNHVFVTKRKLPGYYRYTQAWVDSILNLDQYVVACSVSEMDVPDSQYSESMRAKKQFFMEGSMTATEYAAELDCENEAFIQGANEKTIWLERTED